ncbi:MAG: hypothetical protein ACNI25_01290 [Halarcobacter sp.]
MNFNKLDVEQKQQLHEEITNYANSVGGKNFFLKMIEEIREQKPNPILNKSGIFHTTRLKISLNKTIFKDTFSTLFDAIRREERVGDMLNSVDTKEYKNCMNMMKTLKSTIITVQTKNEEDGEGFSFPILDTSVEKNTKVTFIYKVIFFYHLDEAKKALNYNA